MKGAIPLVIALAGAGSGGVLAAERVVELDHVWVVASPGAPERSALERAGLIIAPTVNRHDGQGTASVTVEFENAFLELLWPDETVPVAPGKEAVAEKFRRKAAWRTNGWSPIGVALRRTPAAPEKLPFDSWPVSAPWMPPGVAYEMLTPRTDAAGPSIWVLPRSMALIQPSGGGKDVGFDREKAMRHPLGARRISGIRIVEPARKDPSDVTRILVKQGVASVERGQEWLLEIRLAGAATHGTIDLRPALPLVLRH
jgi:hypothetical protein